MPCRVTCGARGKGACTLRNGDAALGVQTMHERGQGTGWGVANGRRGRQPSIGHRRWWLGGSGGDVEGVACLLLLGRLGRALGGFGLRKRGRGAWLEQALAGGVLGFLLGGGLALIGGVGWRG
jgi:hypothetical protein